MTNVKSLQKQLFAAIAMVLVAIIAVSSSTYAWFATNTKVTASQMSVTAKTADPFLQIKAGSGTYGTSATFTNEGTELKLVTPKTIGTTMEWGWATSTDPDDAQASNALTDLANVDGYVISQELTLKNASTVDAENLEVMATIANGTDKMNAAARVLVVTAEGKYTLFNASGAVITTGYDATVAAESNKVLKATLAADQELGVTVYVYFDGTDTTAKNTTGLGTNAVTVDLAFTIKGDADNSATA